VPYSTAMQLIHKYQTHYLLTIYRLMIHENKFEDLFSVNNIIVTSMELIVTNMELDNKSNETKYNEKQRIKVTRLRWTRWWIINVSEQESGICIMSQITLQHSHRWHSALPHTLSNSTTVSCSTSGHMVPWQMAVITTTLCSKKNTWPHFWW